MKSVQSKNITTADSGNQLFQKETKKNFFSKSKKPFFTASPVQTKLTVNQPNDPYEQEADAMADKVVQDFSSSSSENISSPFFSAQNNSLQRKCAECEKEDEEKKLQEKSETTSPNAAPAGIESNLSSSKGSGSPLPSAVRSEMEDSFGASFSNVKIHKDSSAAEMNKDLHAQAFTHGDDIYFNSGKYNTDSNSGKHLLAHELTHVLQQNGMNRIQKQEEALTESTTEEAPSQTSETATQPEGPSQTTETGTQPEGPEGTAADAANQSGQFIVEDSEVPTETQMRKSEFLSRLNAEVCATVNEALAGTPHSSDNCPYIREAFARYQNSSAAQIENVVHRYEPSTQLAQSADGIIQLVKVHVYAAALQWAQTGQLLGIPESIASAVSSGISSVSNAVSSVTNAVSSAASGVVSSVVSGVSGAVSSIGNAVSGAGSAVSSIGNMFFKAKAGGGNVSQSPVSVMQSLGKGTQLSGGTRSKMESAFGTSFSDVQIHTDSKAANLSNNMNARAFTVGNHIAFDSGEYKPGSLIGDALMAHELAHVVQQSGTNNSDSHSNNSLENDADESAVSVMTKMMTGKEISSLKKGKGLKTGLRLSSCKGKSTPAPTPTPVTAVTFSEAAAEKFAGYDASLTPNWLVVPVGEGRQADAAITPAGSAPTYVSDKPTVATVAATPTGIAVTGVAAGTANINAMQGSTVIATLKVSVKRRLDKSVAIHFVCDSAPAAAGGPHCSNGAPTANNMRALMNSVWQRQTNVNYTDGGSGPVTAPGNLGASVDWTPPGGGEWSVVTALGTAGASLNIFRVNHYTLGGVNQNDGGTLGSNILFGDSPCADGWGLTHEVGHSLGLDHPDLFIMNPCTVRTDQRVGKTIADKVNP